jgi:hypothetical protein
MSDREPLLIACSELLAFQGSMELITNFNQLRSENGWRARNSLAEPVKDGDVTSVDSLSVCRKFDVSR